MGGGGDDSIFNVSQLLKHDEILVIALDKDPLSFFFFFLIRFL